MKKEERVLIRKKREQRVMQEHEKNSVLYFTFSNLDTVSDDFIHAFSSRFGGVSTGDLYAMNFSVSRGDTKENVTENYRRFAAAVGFRAENLVCSDQTHTNHVRVVTEADRGKGFDREKDYHDVDGLVTNVPGLVLATYYADCVPLFFVDPVHRAVGLSHSGWRGTVSDIAGETVKVMRETYGTNPADLLGAIGPSICQDCYEVSEDVIREVQAQYAPALYSLLYTEKPNGKYQLNLWEACRQNMLRAGLLPEHIAVTDLCTSCNPEVLFSHRASHGHRGNLAGFLGVRG